MSLSKVLLVSMEPDTTNPNVQFFPDLETASERALLLQRTFNRDVFVTTIERVARADRRKWTSRTKDDLVGAHLTHLDEQAMSAIEGWPNP